MEQKDDNFSEETEDETKNQKISKAQKTSSKKSKSQTGSSTTTDHEVEARFSRIKLFEKVMQKSLENFVELASFNRFTSTFRPLYKKNPQRMENIYKQFIEELKGAIQDDIIRLIEEGGLETKLNELDKLENAAKSKTDPAWRPSGVPEQDLCSFLMPYYQKQEAYMKLELKKIQAENVALAEKVLAGRELLCQTDHHISAAVEDLKVSVTDFEKLASALSPNVDV
ncbi:polyamine-modulated factor 1 [Boleophthalmus pectinirostris]|uniref:polyamine-modulated factor 1 n=1 Tax=Boleophthalmus pectinirostris TaxID=150288 RepID=UPI000A1C4047|nr:polyamine-modulated factor 1 [Boleophthalmus pectinirostris]